MSSDKMDISNSAPSPPKYAKERKPADPFRKQVPKKRAPLLPKHTSTGEAFPPPNVFNMSGVTMEVDEVVTETEKYEKEKSFAVPVSKTKMEEMAFKNTPLYKNMKAKSEEGEREVAELRKQVAELKMKREVPSVSSDTEYDRQKARADKFEKLLGSAVERTRLEKLRADKAEQDLSTERAKRAEEYEKDKKEAMAAVAERRQVMDKKNNRIAELEKELEAVEEELNNIPRQVEDNARPIAKPRGKLGKVSSDGKTAGKEDNSASSEEKAKAVSLILIKSCEVHGCERYAF